MIRTPTVLVLGAGASMPYGFPSGTDLVKDVKKPWGDYNKPSKDVLLQCGINEQILTKFRDELSRAQVSSVDAFLEERSDLIKVGKTLIAFYLMQKEHLSSLHAPSKEHPWYHYLFRLMKDGCGFDDYCENRLSIITYNYDRSFEAAMMEHLGGLFGKTPEEAAKAVSRFNIIHVHGQMGYLPELVASESAVHQKLSRRYDPTITANTLQIAAAGIRIIHEAGDDPVFDEVCEVLRGAVHIFFLGFGYHRVNVDRLNIQKSCNIQAMVLGSCMGLSEGECNLARKLFHPRPRRSLEAGIDLYDMKVHQMLSHFADVVLG